ncbi:MAG: outer membrane protein assembly factor BamD [Acidobacteriota bacterium]
MKVSLRAAILSLLLPLVSLAQQNPPEAMAEKLYLNGLKLMGEKLYQQAIQDFQSLLSSFPQSTYADNALLELGKYYFRVERSPQKASEQFERIIREFQGKETAADAYLWKGLVLTESATSEQQLQDGLANFLRTVQFYPSSPAVEQALYQAGITEIRLQHYEPASDYLERCTTDYPLGTAAPGAQLALGKAMFFRGRVERAMLEIQRERDLYPKKSEAAVALRWNSLLWRLYYQPRVDPAGMFKNQTLATIKGTTPVEDCAGLAFDSNQLLYFSDPKAQRIRTIDSDLRVTGGFNAREPAGIFIDSGGGYYVADSTGIAARDTFRPLSYLKGTKRESEIVEKARDVFRTSYGDFYLLEGGDGKVLHYTSSFGFDSVYAPSLDGGVEAMSIDLYDRIALLFKREKKINIYDRRGKLVVTVASQGPGYAFQSPSRIRFDAFGHLYVLDKDLHAVHIFDRDGKLLYQCVVPTMRAPREMAITDSGEIYVWDDKSAGIWVLK